MALEVGSETKSTKLAALSAGVIGKPMELATNSSLENMQARLNGNIDSLDRVMGRNAKLFTGQLNDVLKLREEQLDTLLNRNIKELNSGLSQNIKQLDESIQHGVDGLRSVESFFAKGLWIWTKLLSQLVVFLIVLFFIFKTYERVNRGGTLSKSQLKELVAESKFYVIGFFISLFIIFLFRPLTGRFVDSDFEKQKRIYANNVKAALKLFDYKTAMVYAVGLSKLEPSNSEYDYLIRKIELLKDLLTLIRESQISNESIHTKFEYFKESFDIYEINDPEFYIISALYKRNYYNSKKGYLLATIDCYQYLEKMDDAEKTNFQFYLGPYAYNILNVYYLNPYDKELLLERLREDSISYDERLLSKLTSDTIFNKEVIGFPLLYLNQIAYNRLRSDENLYINYLTDTSRVEIKNLAIDGWISDLRFINSSKYKKIYANQSMIFNDFLAQAILRKYASPKLDSINNVSNVILSNTVS